MIERGVDHLSGRLLRMENISKRFMATVALDKVSFDVNRGEVHMLLGENGAGKSTLMKILSGMHHPDEGTIWWEDRPIAIHSPADSLRLGIGMVYQELTVVNHLSVFENVCLGQLPSRGRFPFVHWKRAVRETEQIMRMLGLDIDVSRPLYEYELGIRQLTEIARAISRKAKLIILDEPTSALTDKEVDYLFQAIRALKAQGVSFIYITHKLKEIFQIGDRVTVLRDGKAVGTIQDLSQTNEAQLIRMMVGRSLEEQYPKQSHTKPKEILSVHNLGDGRNFNGVSFKLYEGEVLGIAGLVGSGASELAECLYGLRAPAPGAKIRVFSEPYIPTSPAHAIRRGIGMLTKDRKGGLLLHMPIYENITVARKKTFSTFGFLRRAQKRKSADHYVQKLQINCRHTDEAVGNLSGGNQQKVAIAKWLCNDTRLFIMDDPTRGIDVGAKVEVYKLMNEITSKGGGIFLISSELPELLGMSDRILAMREGRIVAEFKAGQCTQEQIMEKVAGGDVR